MANFLLIFNRTSKFITRRILLIRASEAFCSLARIEFNRYPCLPCRNFPSIGILFRLPSLHCCLRHLCSCNFASVSFDGHPITYLEKHAQRLQKKRLLSQISSPANSQNGSDRYVAFVLPCLLFPDIKKM